MKYELSTVLSPQAHKKIKVYYHLLTEWNRRTGLVQVDTLPDFNNRHILDSLQLIPILNQVIDLSLNNEILPDVSNEFISTPETLVIPLLPQNGSLLDTLSLKTKDVPIIDVGSGAGFPGMVLAICGFSKISLCESNHKKCMFLEEVARKTHTTVTIIHDRVENIKNKYDCIVSRACTDLLGLCKIMNTLSKNESSIGLFLKGRTWLQELSFAQQKYKFQTNVYKSITSDESVVLGIHHLKEN